MQVTVAPAMILDGDMLRAVLVGMVVIFTEMAEEVEVAKELLPE